MEGIENPASPHGQDTSALKTWFVLDQCASVPSSSYKLCSRRPSKQLIAFFFCSLLLKIRSNCSAYSTPSSFLVPVDEMTIASPRGYASAWPLWYFLFFLLQWVSWVTCAQGNVMDATLRATFCHCGHSHAAATDAATVSHTTTTWCLWRGGAECASDCNHCAIVVGGCWAWARKLLSFFHRFLLRSVEGWRKRKAWWNNQARHL